ncbi:glycosyltransferase family 4 protein [Saccharothrix variisporea]|uniref:Glycosyltransferase involved in cell wall biosynthesis n=1 Tax=Saccharothrix variisporea TaxID=543527 RepID=A0A495X4F3_9PSEU|nr:glycosyltransferase family 4 protein [Saccharothrix variisporea]RKT68115.1 glycosyltransferase involved in cell wall biosynthesis [Saccharothrix variisporea]
MTWWFVVPAGVADPAAPSGGNGYDRRVSAGLGARDVLVAGTWPQPSEASRRALDQALAQVPDGEVVLVDGLVACGVPEVVLPHARRVRVAVLVHLPLAEEVGLSPAVAARLDAAERECLRGVSAVIATGAGAAARVAERHGLGRVHSVPPGVEPAAVASGTDGVSRLLTVASVTPRKGHDVLARALATVLDHRWVWAVVGPTPDAGHLAAVRELTSGFAERVEWVGPLVGGSWEREYERADLFVLPSWAETYGMVVTEALARAVPVMASAVPDALAGGGLLLPSGDVEAWSGALRRWFESPELREELRGAASRRRGELSTWDETVKGVGAVLASLRA